MKRNGNLATNKVYNPKNRQPDIPVDADEVDSAMERFIRKKYQEKSLSDGRPEPPRRNDPQRGLSNDSQPGLSMSPDNSPPPPLPPKKGKFFGFGLRASSSAYPLSKHDKKNASREPRVDSAFRIASENYGSERRSGSSRQMSGDEMQSKLATLRDMGFKDDRRNTTVLTGLGGNMERTIESLVKIQQTANTGPEEPTPGQTSRGSQPAVVSEPSRQIPQSNNPYDQQMTTSGFGISYDAPKEQPQPSPSAQAIQQQPTNNPFGVPVRSQTEIGLQQAFQNVQISQPLFPNSTGGYPVQASPLYNRTQHSMTPPVTSISQQYGYTASPMSAFTNNPFFQQTPQPRGTSFTKENAFPAQPLPSPSAANPFYSNPSQYSQTMSQSATQPTQSATFNPFGLPPANAATSSGQATSSLVIYDQQSQQYFPSQTSQQHHYTQPQAQFQSQSFPQHLPQAPIQSSAPGNFQSFSSFQQPPQNQYSFQPTPQQPYLQQQQTGRADKASIMALYNYPQLAPQPLASIPEPDAVHHQQQQSPTFQSQSSNPFNTTTPQSPNNANIPIPPNDLNTTQSRNPFLNMTSSNKTISPQPTNNPYQQQCQPRSQPQSQSQPQPYQQPYPQPQTNPYQAFLPHRQAPPPPHPTANTRGIARHASADSVSVNNAAFEAGRHSPDAFASLSARYA